MARHSLSMLFTSVFMLTALFFGAAVDVDVELPGDYPRTVSGLLTINEPYDAGKWGKSEFCPAGSFVHGLVIRLEEKGAFDDTAINAVKLYCRALNQTHDNIYVISARSVRGHWCDVQTCTEGFMTSFRARVRPKGGLLIDDTAVQDFQAQCGEQLLRGVPVDKQFRSGQWSRWAECPPQSAVCGLKTRVQTSLLDNVALTDAQLFCCPLEN